MDVSGQTERLCLLAMLAGREELCASEECPLWENGSCVLENLPPDGEPDADWPDSFGAANAG
jgi:hypothetical protein